MQIRPGGPDYVVVRVESGLLATGDIDMLFDSRRNLKLISPGIGVDGLLGLLRKVDPSFSLTERRSFRAVNDGGFMVDLIKPTPKNAISTTERATLGCGDDMRAVEIEGLKWLVNSPKRKMVVIDERGYPLEVSVPDPRSFAIHKAWLSSREDRELIKCKRDGGQARLVAELAKERLPHLRFDAHDLTTLQAAISFPRHRSWTPPLPTKGSAGPAWSRIGDGELMVRSVFARHDRAAAGVAYKAQL